MTCSKEEGQDGEGQSDHPTSAVFFKKFLQPYFGVACSEPLHGLRAGARRNAQPRKIQQAEGPAPGVFQRPLFPGRRRPAAGQQ